MKWDEKIAWMRAKGVVQAQWSVDDELVMAALGPEVVPPGPEEKAPPANEPSFEEMLLMSA